MLSTQESTLLDNAVGSADCSSRVDAPEPNSGTKEHERSIASEAEGRAKGTEQSASTGEGVAECLYEQNDIMHRN